MNLIEAINQWAVVWAEFMYIRFLDSTLVFLLLGMIWLCVRRTVSAQFGYLLFLLVPLKLITPVQLSIPGFLSDWIPTGVVQEKLYDTGNFGWFEPWGEGSGSDTRSAVFRSESKDSTPAPATPAIHAVTAFMLIWMGGVFFFLLYQIRVEWKTRLLMHSTVALNPQRFPIDLQDLQKIAGVKRQVNWVTGSWVKSPVAYGYFHPRIAVPADIAQHYTVRQLRWILLHELAHIQRGDAFAFLLQRILQSLFFFHPFVWWANAILDQLREYACDDAALAGSQSSPRECGEGFLGAVMQSNGLPTFLLATHGLINYKTMIRRRLMRILNSKPLLQIQLSNTARSFLFLMALLVIPFSWKVAIAQVGEWVMADIDSADSPSPRSYQGMAYDGTRGVVVMHGGSLTNETWEWNGATKTWANVSNEGPNLMAFDMAYDPVRDEIVLSGGSYEKEIGYTETWEWDRNDWKLVAEEDGSHIYPAMAYHPERKTIIRHGGFFDTNLTPTPATMEWDGEQWKPLPDGPPLSKHRMVYDSVRNKMVIFGGLKELGVMSNETWEFDGVTWTKVAETGPEGRDHYGMVFDPDRGVTVLFGGGLIAGEGFNDHSFDDMWQWDGKEWTQIDVEGPTNPDQNFGINMAYDAHQHQIVLFGGNFGDSGNNRPNDTWLFGFQSGFMKNTWLNY